MRPSITPEPRLLSHSYDCMPCSHSSILYDHRIFTSVTISLQCGLMSIILSHPCFRAPPKPQCHCSLRPTCLCFMAVCCSWVLSNSLVAPALPVSCAGETDGRVSWCPTSVLLSVAHPKMRCRKQTDFSLKAKMFPIQDKFHFSSLKTCKI